jgi:glutamate/tyrosine decarboxylase-like PLP-dependent enzyme
MIGLLPDQLHSVAADTECRLDVSSLATAVDADRRAGDLPWAVVANAGATRTGSVDPLDASADLCSRNQLWLHVDAAYGWPAVLVPTERSAFSGIARADSITLDPHKWFAQPYEAGCVLIKDGKRLAQTFHISPDYMQDVEPAIDEVNFADQGLALTRRFRALKIWFSVKVLGVEWFRDLVDRSCRLAEYAQALLEQSPSFEILSPRRLSVVCFRYVPTRAPCTDDDLNALNLAIVDRARESGRAFPSSTKLNGKVALRLCFVSWRTTSADVDLAIKLFETIGADLANQETTDGTDKEIK